jgi:anaerobic selenocysteine-containing dehydrogenase
MLVEVYNELGSYRVRARIGHQARPGVVIVLGLWWRKHSFDGRGANELIAETLTDLGKAPAFYDCSVDVRIIND